MSSMRNMSASTVSLFIRYPPWRRKREGAPGAGTRASAAGFDLLLVHGPPGLKEAAAARRNTSIRRIIKENLDFHRVKTTESAAAVG